MQHFCIITGSFNKDQDLRKNHFERWIFELLEQVISQKPMF